MKKESLKKPKMKKRQSMNLPKEDLYLWNVLQSIVKDARAAVTPEMEWLPMILDELEQIIRERDVIKYLSFCDLYNLTSLNKIFGCRSAEQSVREIRWIYLLSIGKKFDFTKSPIDKQAAALNSFLSFEDDCKLTNLDSIFHDLWNDETNHSFLDDEFYSPCLMYASEFIRRVLGDEPMLQDISSAVHHGPGATTKKSGNDSVPIMKYCPPIDVTSQAKNILSGFILTDHRWSRSLFDFHKRTHELPDESLLELQILPLEVLDQYLSIEDSSRILFVPKNAKTYRTICAEPTGNVYLQLAVNNVIRSRLRRVGIDITTQEKNQKLALKGSLTDTLVTVDLSGASDTVAHIWLSLFPAKWAALLDALRCSSGLLGDEKYTFEKLSAMGNGYTFCIETLLFSSLIYAVMKYRGLNWEENLPSTTVYGDDIIIPKTVYSDLVRVLVRFGFKINTEKSFASGPVRESCGCDFFNGQLISRPTIKSVPKSEWEVTRDYNLLYLLSRDYKLDLQHTLTRLYSWIPKKKQNWGPMNREDATCWLFCDEPMVKVNTFCPGTDEVASNLQMKVCKVRRYKLGLKNTKSEYPASKRFIESVFSPMMFLTHDGNPVKSVKVANLKLPTNNSHPEDSYWFDRMSLKCTTTDRKSVV